MAKKAAKKAGGASARKGKKAAKRVGPKEGTTYFSVQSLERAVNKGTRSVRSKAVKSAGFTVVQRGNWVVREFADGRSERVSQIVQTQRSGYLALD